MNKIMRTLPILLIPMLMLTGITPIGIAYASKPTPVSGTFTVVAAGVPDIRPAGNSGNIIITQSQLISYTGDTDGSYTINMRMVLRPTGEGTVHATAEVTVTAIFGEPASGTVTMHSTAQIDGASYGGTWVFIKGSGTGDMENVHGDGIWSGTVGVGGTWSGQLHFDP